MRQPSHKQIEKSNQCRMFLLNYIDSEFKTKKDNNVYFHPKETSVVSNCKIQFKETYTFNEKTNTIDCVINKVEHIEFSTSSFNTLPSLSSIANSVNVKEDNYLRTYCQMLKDPTPKVKRRKKGTQRCEKEKGSKKSCS